MVIVKRFFSLAVLAVSSSLVVSQVNAGGSSDTTFNVKLNVMESCSLSKPNDIDFGSASLSDLKDKSASTTLNVACTSGTTYSLNMWGNGNLKTTSNSSSLIPYKVEFNNSGSGLSSVSNLTGTGINQSYTIAATLLGNNTNVVAGNYSDTVTTQISY